MVCYHGINSHHMQHCQDQCSEKASSMDSEKEFAVSFILLDINKTNKHDSYFYLQQMWIKCYNSCFINLLAIGHYPFHSRCVYENSA